MEKKLYFKNLDASRFFAFVLVFMAHCFVTSDEITRNSSVFRAVYDWGKVGILGLEYFFVLSSFLISIIILEEKKQSQNFNIVNFLMRRTLRVWPLYFLIVAIGFVILFVAPFFNISLNPLPDWPYLFFFLVNFYIINHGSEFLFFIAFLWSISVEEQFYLFWSVFMKFIHNRFAVFCWILIAVSIGFRIFFIDDSKMLFFHTVSALGNFGVGGLLAIAIFNKKKIVTNIINWSKPTVTMIYFLMFLSIIFFHQLMEFEVFRASERLIYSLFFAFFILDQSMGNNSIFQCGKLPVFNYLGKISYGLYCFHGVVITLFIQIIPFAFTNQNLLIVFVLFPLIIFAFTILLSHFSYRYFERRFLLLKQKFYTFQP